MGNYFALRDNSHKKALKVTGIEKAFAPRNRLGKVQNYVKNVNTKFYYVQLGYNVVCFKSK